MKTVFEKAKNIKCLVCDLDGVLTEGTLFYGEEGEIHKAFHCHDGFGLKLIMSVGIEVAVITTAKIGIVDKRMKALNIKHVYAGMHSKAEAFEDLMKRLQLRPEEIASVGDDLPDLAMLRRSGLKIAVANATKPVKAIADWITTKSGGQGAVREVCELLLDAQNKTDLVIAGYHDA